MSTKIKYLALSIICLWTQGCFLDTKGKFTIAEDANASDQTIFDTFIDSGSNEANTSDSAEDIELDTIPDTFPEADVIFDVIKDIDNEGDVSEDVVLDIIEADPPIDSTIDSLEADALEPTECFGIPTETGNIMICAELPNGTSKSFMIKAGLDYPDSSGIVDIPFKPVCWSSVGVGNLACFPCPGSNVCWPVPDGGLVHSPVVNGTIVKFQPGIADYPGGSMKNTLCDLGKCYQAR